MRTFLSLHGLIPNQAHNNNATDMKTPQEKLGRSNAIATFSPLNTKEENGWGNSFPEGT